MSLTQSIKRSRSAALGALAALACASLPAQSEPALTISGAGWTQLGRVMSSSDTVGGNDPAGRGLLGTGAQFAMTFDPTEQFHIEAGLGAAAGHSLAAHKTLEGGYAPFDVGTYVANANFRYSFWNEEESKLQFTGGLFPYNYNPDAHNLGLYLLRGPVYPGYLVSGFETGHVLPVANTFGFRAHHQTGGFRQDVLLTFERDFFPYWDLSPAYVASYQTSAFRIGAGANFYHLIPVDPDLTWRYVQYVDTVPAVDDTTHLPFNGIKVMATGALDFKALFGAGGGDGMLGAEDLKVYFETAIIGLDNGPMYKKLYGEYSNRMPIMVGINLPAFKLLDRLSLEVQQYKAKFQDDYSQYNHYSNPSPIPFGRRDTAYTADDLKWSLYGSKVIKNHVKISVQAASDHFRPGIFKGYGDNRTPSQTAILTRPSEWYWNAKVAYFF